MTKLKIAILLAMVLPDAHTVHADTVTIVQSVRVKPYEDAIRGFESIVNARIERIVISEKRGANLIGTIKKSRPAAILTVGSASLEKVRSIREIPIIYMMVLNPNITERENKNVTGVVMNIHPRKCFKTISGILPGTRRIGFLYDSLKSGDYARHSLEEAGKTGFELKSKIVTDSRQVSSALDVMKDEMDAYWMLPDTTVLTPETIRFVFLHSFRKKIPVITFSDKYAEMGAVLSVGIDAFDIGRQAGEMMEKILNGGDVAKVPRAYARKANVTVNRKIAKKMGVEINTGTAGNIRIID